MLTPPTAILKAEFTAERVSIYINNRQIHHNCCLLWLVLISLNKQKNMIAHTEEEGREAKRKPFNASLVAFHE